MSPIHTPQGQLDQMQNLVSAMKQVVDDIMDSKTNKLYTDQMASECSETFFYICLGREDCLPKKHQANLVPYYSTALEHHVSAAQGSLKYLLLESRKARTPTQQAEYLLELFKNVHKNIHPNAALIVAKSLSEKSQQTNSGPNVLTLDNGPANPPHVKKMESIILAAEKAVRDTMGSMLGQMDEQMMGEFTQTFFYTSLALDKYLPEDYQGKIVPYMKAFMVPSINAAKLSWLEIAKDLAVVPNDFLLPQLINLFKIAFKNLHPTAYFLDTTDTDRIPMN